MLVTNNTAQDYWFGPLHLEPNAVNYSVDDTSATSLYLTDDGVADAINALYAAGKISVSGAATPFPRPTGEPQILHGDGSPEGLVYAGQGSMFMVRTAASAVNFLYTKTTGLHLNTGWVAINPSSAIAVATTVAGLGTGTSGAQGLLRVGSSPFDFLALVYDSTLNKWVSEERLFAGQGLTSINNISPSTWSDFGPGMVSAMPYGAFVTAGLTLQVRLALNLQSNGTASLSAGYLIETANTDATSYNASTDVALISGYTSSSDTLKVSDWANVQTVTSVAWARLKPRIMSNTNNTGSFRYPSLQLRWVG